jgi:hypothetical protein
MKSLQIICISLLISFEAFCQMPPKIIDTLQNKNLIIFSNKKYGISKNMNNVQLKYDTLYQPSPSEYLFVKLDNFWGVVDFNDNIIIPIVYELVDQTWYDNYTGIDTFLVQKNHKFGTVDFHNNIVIPFNYDAISNWVENGPDAHYVSINGKMGLIDHNGKEIVQSIYDSIYCYTYKVIKVKLNGKLGVINSENKIIIPLEYDALIADVLSTGELDIKNHEDKFIVRKNGKWDYLNYNGKIIRSNIPVSTIEKKFPSFKIYNYDFYYIGKCLIKPNDNYR